MFWPIWDTWIPIISMRCLATHICSSIPNTLTIYSNGERNLLLWLKERCPLRHLKEFLDICGLIPLCPNSPKYLQIHLFHLSLGDEAKD